MRTFKVHLLAQNCKITMYDIDGILTFQCHITPQNDAPGGMKCYVTHQGPTTGFEGKGPTFFCRQQRTSMSQVLKYNVQSLIINSRDL